MARRIHQGMPFHSSRTNDSKYANTGDARNQSLKAQAALIERVAAGMAAGISKSLEKANDAIAVRFDNEYARAKSAEEGTMNVTAFPQGNPAQAIREVGVVMGDSRKVFQGGGPKGAKSGQRPADLAGLHTGVKSVVVKGNIVSYSALNNVQDRTAAQELKIDYLYPIKDEETGKVTWFVRELRVHGRGGGDKGAGTKWRLWKAMEYGTAAGKWDKVFVRKVASYNKGPKADKIKNAWLISSPADVQFGSEWVVFMSKRYASGGRYGYWGRAEEICLQHGLDCIRVEDSGYTGGTHPIGSVAAELKDAVRESIRAEVNKVLRGG